MSATAWANARGDYIAATRERGPVRPGYPSDTKTVRDCALTPNSAVGRTRIRVPATVGVTGGYVGPKRKPKREPRSFRKGPNLTYGCGSRTVTRKPR